MRRMCFGVFLTMVETTITATALVSIGVHFKESTKVIKSKTEKRNTLEFYYQHFNLGKLGRAGLLAHIYGFVVT